MTWRRNSAKQRSTRAVAREAVVNSTQFTIDRLLQMEHDADILRTNHDLDGAMKILAYCRAQKASGRKEVTPWELSRICLNYRARISDLRAMHYELPWNGRRTGSAYLLEGL